MITILSPFAKLWPEKDFSAGDSTESRHFVWVVVRERNEYKNRSYLMKTDPVIFPFAKILIII